MHHRLSAVLFIVFCVSLVKTLPKDQVHVLRTKRGILGLLGKAVATSFKSLTLAKSLKTTSKSTLGNGEEGVSFREILNDPSINDGCISFPSLCSNKQEVVRLMDLTKTKLEEVDQERKKNILKVNPLKESNANNRHILHQINETEQTLLQVINKDRNIVLELQKHANKLLETRLQTMYFTEENHGFYVDRLLEPFEYRLSGLKRLLGGQKLKLPEVLAVQAIGETTVKSLIYIISQYFSTLEETRSQMDEINLVEYLFKFMAKNTTISADEIEILTDVKNPSHIKVAAKYGLSNPQYKLAWKMVQNIAQEVNTETSHGFLDLYGKTVPEQANIWKMNKFESSLKLNMGATLLSLKNKFHNLNFRFRHASSTFVFTFRKTNWDTSFQRIVNNTKTAIIHAIREKNWNTAAEKMENMKTDLKTYVRKIDNELQGVLRERENMTNLEKECKQQFTETMEPVANFLSANKLSSAFMVSALRLQTSVVNASGTDCDENNNYILSQQENLRYVRHLKHGLDRIKSWSSAQLMVFNYVSMATERKEQIIHMHGTLQNLFAFQSVEVRKHGNGIEIAELLCIVSLIRRDIDDYDGYSLKSIRGNCFTHNATSFTQGALNQYRKAIIQNKVMNEVRTKESEDPVAVLDAVIRMFINHADSRFRPYGKVISEKDILCVIASIFTRKDTYGFYNLFQFRPNCSALSDAAFTKLKNKALKKRRELNEKNLKIELCKTQGMCSTSKPTVAKPQVNPVGYSEMDSKQPNAGTREKPQSYMVEILVTALIICIA